MGRDQYPSAEIVDDFLLLYHQPHVPEPRDPWDSLNGSHFQSGDLGSQSITGTENPGLSDELNALNGSHFQSGDLGSQPIAGTENPGSSDELNALNGSPLQSWGYGPYGNQSVAGTENPGSSENFDELNQLNRFQFREFGNQTLPGTEEAGSKVHIGPESFRIDWEEFDQMFSQDDRSSWVSYNLSDGGRLCEIQPPTQPHLGQPAAGLAAAGNQNRLARKREIDRAYRQRKKEKTEKLVAENKQLKAYEDEVDRLIIAIRGNKHKMNSKLMELWRQISILEMKISQLQGANRSVNNRLEAQSMKLDQLQEKLEFMHQLTTQHLDKGNKKAKETLKEMAERLDDLRAEHEKIVAAVKDDETLLESLLSGLQLIWKQLSEMLHDVAEEEPARFQNAW